MEASIAALSSIANAECPPLKPTSHMLRTFAEAACSANHHAWVMEDILSIRT